MSLVSGTTLLSYRNNILTVSMPAAWVTIQAKFRVLLDQYGFIDSLVKQHLPKQAGSILDVLCVHNGTEYYTPYGGNKNLAGNYIVRTNSSGFVSIYHKELSVARPLILNTYYSSANGSKGEPVELTRVNYAWWNIYHGCVDMDNNPLQDDPAPPPPLYTFNVIKTTNVSDAALAEAGSGVPICGWFSNKAIIIAYEPTAYHVKGEQTNIDGFTLDQKSPKKVLQKKYTCCSKYDEDYPYGCLEPIPEGRHEYTYDCGFTLKLPSDTVPSYLPPVDLTKYLPFTKHDSKIMWYYEHTQEEAPTPWISDDCMTDSNITDGGPNGENGENHRKYFGKSSSGRGRYTLIHKPVFKEVSKIDNKTKLYTISEEEFNEEDYHDSAVDIVGKGIYYGWRFKLHTPKGHYVNYPYVLPMTWYRQWNTVQQLTDTASTNFGQVLFVKSSTYLRIHNANTELEQRFLFINGKDWWEEIHEGIYKLHKEKFDYYLEQYPGNLENMTISYCNYL
jgi:hypothetical protein